MAEIKWESLTLSAGTGPTVYYYLQLRDRQRPSSSQMRYTFRVVASMSSGGSLGSGSLDARFIVADATYNFTIKSHNETWPRGTTKTFDFSITCTSTTGNARQNCRFTVTSDYFSSSGRIDTTDLYVTSLAITPSYTNCVAPRNVQAPSPFEYTSAWYFTSGGGTNNPVVGYEIQYQTKPKQGSYSGTWIPFDIISTRQTVFDASSPLYIDLGSVVPRGYQVRINIRARGEAGYHSDWTVTGSITRNSAPVLTGDLLTDKQEFKLGESITLSWNAATDADGNLNGYVLQRQSGDEWMTVKTLGISDLTTEVIPASTDVNNRQYIIYRLYAVDRLGAISDYIYTAPILRNDATIVYVGVDNEAREALLYYGVNGEARPCALYVGWQDRAVPLSDVSNTPTYALLTDENGTILTDQSGKDLSVERIWWENA